jgi:PKD repeat protein
MSIICVNFRFPLLFLLVFLACTANAQLNGTYSIDGTKTASSTNYRTFASAIFDLTSAGGVRPDGGPRNGPSVTGPVIFTVAAGTYTEQIDLNPVTGTSTTNTVTFDGGAGNASSRIITHNSFSNTDAHTFRIKASNIHLRNLTVRTIGATYGAAVHFMSNPENCSVRNCIIENAGLGATSSSTYIMGILVNNSNVITNLYINGNPGTLELDSNIIRNGYFGIYYYASSAKALLTVKGNSFIDQFAYGLYVYDCDILKCLGNNMSIRSSSTVSSSAIYLYGSVPGVTGFHDISNNVITNVTYGINVSYSGSFNDTLSRSRVNNNMIGGGFKNNYAMGIAMVSAGHFDIYHNSVNLDFPTIQQTGACLYVSGSAGIDIKNNMLAYTATTGLGLPFYSFSNKGISGLDHNNYYKANIALWDPLIYLNSTTYSTLDYKGAVGFNNNSVSVLPFFAGPKNLHTVNPCNRGTSSYLSTDIDGDARSSSIPNLGADEFGGVNDDAGLLSVVYPSFPLSSGQADIVVVLKNYGSNTLTSANIHYTINGGSPQTLAWTGSLGNCATDTVRFTGSQQYNFTGGTYDFTAYTSSPNGTTDPVVSNDTQKVSLCIALSGNYTIDPAGSGNRNFTSFNQAVSAMKCGGVSAAVYFSIAPGLYYEQVEIKNVQGLSAGNHVTFDGGNASTCILAYNAVQNNAAHTLRISSSPYIRLRNLTIDNSSSFFGAALHIKGLSHGSSIKNCVISISGPGASSNSNYFYPVLVNDADNIYTSTGTRVRDLEIDSNTIRYGYYGIFVDGLNTDCSNISVRGNLISEVSYIGAYFDYVNGVNFSGNNVNMRKTGSLYSGGLYMSNCICTGTNSHRILGNRVVDAGQTGISVINSYNFDTLHRCLMANNMIGGAFRYQDVSALSMYQCNFWDVLHNTVNMDTIISTAPGEGIGIFYSNGVVFKNNQTAITAPSPEGLCFYTFGSSFTELDYNNYYRKVTGALIDLGGNPYFSNTFKGAQGFNLHSTDVNPIFKDRYDLHILNPCVGGDTTALVSTDIDGENRDIMSPDVGADEIEGTTDDAGIFEILSPLFPVAAGMQDITVVLKNFGKNPLTSVNVNYTVNGGNLQTLAWTGSLSSCDTAVITFTGSRQFNFAGSAFQLKVYTSAPNGLHDSMPVNDTVSIKVCPTLNGTFTIDPAGSGPSNFKSFTEAAEVLTCAGINGPILINVAPATYYEQLNLGFVTGASATNTITFKGTDSITTILTHSGTLLSPHTIKIDRSNHVSIQNLTIINTGTTDAIAVHITNSSDSILISGCLVKLNASATSNSVIGIAIMGKTMNVTTNEGDANTIRNCAIEGGGIGIMLSGHQVTFSFNNRIEHNSILNSYNYGIYVGSQDLGEILSNNVQTRPTSSNADGIYVVNSRTVNVERNYVKSAYYGIGIFNYVAAGSLRSRVVNNILFNQNYPLYAYSQQTDFFHNTTFQNATSGGGFFLSGGAGNSIRNNTFFKQTGNGSCIIVNNTSSVNTWDHNNYYSKGGGTLATVAGNPYTSLLALKAANSQFNQNSVSVAPDFVSATLPDLHLKPAAPAPSGDSAVNVMEDFDNEPRCRVAPTIGADESKFIVPMPFADFTLPDTAWLNSPVYFFNKANSPYAEMYEWDILNDGSIDFVSRNASYIFTTAGTYEVKMISTNCNGKDTVVKSLVIDTARYAPVANFTVDENVIDVWQTINLLDSSLNGPTTWDWSVTPSANVYFSSNTVFDPSVTIGEPGLYTVCLTVTNDAGSDQICKTALVKVRYITNMCVSPFDTKAAEGRIFDSGGPQTNYTNSENCTFLLNPCADTVKLTFSAFSLLSGDWLLVFDGADSTGIPLHTGQGFSGNIIPPTLIAKSGKMFIQSKTNASGNSTGYAASWTSVPGTFTPPVASFVTNTFTQDVGFENSPIIFSSTSTGTELSYSWDIDNDGIEDASTKNTEFTFTSAGVYTVKLRVENCGGVDVSYHQVAIVTPASPPLVDFTADMLVASTSDIVSFTDKSDQGPYSWKWNFTPSTVTWLGGTDSTTRDPKVRFNAAGTYTVKLTAVNSLGAADLTKTAYITVVAYCTPTTSSLSSDAGISNVKLKGINNSSPSGQSSYTDYSGNGQHALLAAGEKATLQVSRPTIQNPINRKAWIDYNMDGVFDATEQIMYEPPAFTLTHSASFTVPKSTKKGYTRMRVATSNITDPNTACGPNIRGEYEDYRIITVADTVKPLITLTGGDTVSSEQWYHFNDPGYSAADNVDGNMTSRVKRVSNVDSSITGYYIITYNATDSAGNIAEQKTRVVQITPDVTKPVIKLTGASVIYLEVFSSWAEPGYSASDYYNKDLTQFVVISSAVDTAKVGSYEIAYEVADAAGNTHKVIRTVVIRDTQRPVITLNGPVNTPHCLWRPYTDAGAVVNDNYYQGLQVTVSGFVNIMVEGEYKLTFTAVDSSGNVAIGLFRYVTVTNCSVGIEEQMKDGNFLQVYPNPSEGIFNITTARPVLLNELKVFNSLGKEVSDFRLNALPAYGSYQLDMSRFAAGVYFIQAGNAGEIMRSKVTIVR